MAMTVQCTSCSTSFPVDPAKVPPEGVRARCSVCDAIFRVERPVAPSEPAPRAVEEPPSHGAEAAGTGHAPPPATEATSSFGGSTSPAAPPAATPDTAGPVDDWVIEREPEVNPDDVEVRRLDTVEEGIRSAQDEFAGGSSDGTRSPSGVSAAPDAPSPEAPPATPPAPVQGFTFGRRDPRERASRLARVLVSDMVTYNAELHQRALSNGTVKEDFEDEIRKSWEEYVEQVGQEVAEGTDFFNDALNEILARGERIF